MLIFEVKYAYKLYAYKKNECIKKGRWERQIARNGKLQNLFQK